MREIRMTQNTKLKNETIDQTHFQSLIDVVKDSKLSQEDKTNALNTWEQDVRRLLTASNKSMPGSEEGLD
jgi:hypothetical protein